MTWLRRRRDGDDRANRGHSEPAQRELEFAAGRWKRQLEAKVAELENRVDVIEEVAGIMNPPKRQTG
jgi:hypothetical protein